MTLSDRLSTELIDTVIKADVGAYTEKELQAYLAPGQVNFLTRVRDKLMHDIEADLKGLLPLIADEPLSDAELKANGINPQRQKDALTGRNNAIREITGAIEHYCRRDT